jgi:PAS domain S-box-containing protein
LEPVIAAGPDPSEPALDRLTRVAVRSLRAAAAGICFPENGHVHVRSAVGPRGGHAEAALCRRVAAGGQPVAVENGEAGAFLGVPVVAADGAAAGCLHVRDRGPRAWSGEEVALLADLAAMAAVVQDVSDRRRTIRERDEALALSRLRARQLQRVARAGLAVAAAQDVGETLAIITEEARTIIGAHQAVTSRTPGPDWSRATVRTSLSAKYAAWSGYEAAPDGTGIYAEVRRSGRPMRLTQAELEAHPLWRGFGREAGRHPPMRGWLAAPLVGHDGTPLGIIQLSDKVDGTDFTEADEAILVQLAALGAAVVEKAETDAELRLAMDRTRIALAAGAMGVWEWDMVGRRIVCSDELYRILDCPRDAFDGSMTGMLELVVEEDRHLLRGLTAQALGRPDGTCEVEFRVRRSDGTVRWIHGRGQIRRDARGLPERLVGVAMDVTERKEAETRLRRLLDGLGAFAGLLMPDGTMIECNRVALDAAALGPEDVIGRPFWETYWWSWSPAVAARLKEAVREAAAGTTVRYDAEMRVAGDRLIAIDFTLAPLRDAGGRVAYLVPSATDITARKHAEAALKDSEARLRLALDAGRMAIFEWRVGEGRIAWTELGYGLFGLDPASGPIAPERFFALIHPADREAVRAHVRELLEGEGATYRAEFRVVPPEGEPLWLAGRGAVLRDAAGRAARLVGVHYDVMQRKQAEERQRLLIGELNHRVKNTLAVIRAMASHTLQTAASPAAFVELFQGRLQALAGAHALLTRRRWEAVELGELVRAELMPHLGEQASRLEAAGPAVTLGPDLAVTLALILHELATNAVKYGALSVPGGRVRIRWEHRAGPGSPIELTWEETGGPPVRPPERQGFGMRMIRSSLRHQGQGEAELAFRPDGLCCRITLPPD